MALSKEQWFSKISAWVPTWFFESEFYQVAYFMGIAKLLSDVQQFSEDERDDTFILLASPESLSSLGAERGIEQGASESQESYAVRVQHIVNVANPAALLIALNATLNNGPALLIENFQYGFFDDAIFCDTFDARWLDETKTYDIFTVIVPVQTAGVDADIMTGLVNAIDANKAFGVLADVLYNAT
jgi:hypothetical protein